MKRIFIVLIASVALAAFAGNVSAQVKFGAGYSMTPHHLKSGDNTSSYELHGFNAGLTYDVDFIGWEFLDFGVVTGLNYELLTDQETEHVDLFDMRMKATLTEHYLNVPLHLNLGLNIIPHIFGVYVFAGPTLSFGLASSTEASLEIAGNKGVIKYNNYNEQHKTDIADDAVVDFVIKGMPADYGWFDVKLGAGLGVEIADAIDLKAGYDWGLVNRYTGDADNFKHLSDRFYITLSYIF